MIMLSIRHLSYYTRRLHYRRADKSTLIRTYVDEIASQQTKGKLQSPQECVDRAALFTLLLLLLSLDLICSILPKQLERSNLHYLLLSRWHLAKLNSQSFSFEIEVQLWTDRRTHRHADTSKQTARQRVVSLNNEVKSIKSACRSVCKLLNLSGFVYVLVSNNNIEKKGEKKSMDISLTVKLEESSTIGPDVIVVA